MPTREALASFWRDWDGLTPQQQRAFRNAVAQFVTGLGRGEQRFQPALRVKRVQGHPSTYLGDDLGARWSSDVRVRTGITSRRAARHLAADRDALDLPPAVGSIRHRFVCVAEHSSRFAAAGRVLWIKAKAKLSGLGAISPWA